MTLDDETAASIAREVVDGGKATRVYPHSTDVALVRAGYAARDAEVEELRARLARVREWAESVALQPEPPADDEMAGQINAAGDVLAILDESPTDVETALAGAGDVEKIEPDFATSPTERETPADEPIAKRLTHTYMGDCPDDVNGWESRDPECPACRALMGCGYR